MAGFDIGAEAFIVENKTRVRPVRIIAASGGLYTLGFLDGPGATRLKEGRIHRTREDAEGSVTIRRTPEVRGYRNPHTMGYLI